MKPIPDSNDFERMIRRIVADCADCDTCRFLMDESCLFFPELYRLHDLVREGCREVTEADLQQLTERCTLCGLCPCPDIVMDVIHSKTERVKANGMPLQISLLADVQRFGRLGGLAAGTLNHLLSLAPICRAVKSMAGIHPKRRLPKMPDESFFEWARRKGLNKAPRQESKVAYFAGCTAGYLFPQVARDAVSLLQNHGIGVMVPEQQCCGMPTLLEGDACKTLERIRFNLDVLLDALRRGFNIVCSCPTCGFMMRMLLKEGAYYSEAYQQAVAAESDQIRIPDTGKAAGGGFVRLKKTIYASILRDDGYFSSIDPLDRIALAENITDLGHYLQRRLTVDADPSTHPALLQGRMLYYAPCHLREQKIGTPYLDLLSRIPGLTVETVGNAMDCCGMGGSLGFKASFYDASMRLASPLIAKIQAAAPDAVITDCLSCRLQFEHLLACPVYHPVEILVHAIAGRSGEMGGSAERKRAARTIE